MRNKYKILVGKIEGNRSLGICRWEDNIKMDVTGIELWVCIAFIWLS
jgi:hypothetical protein